MVHAEGLLLFRTQWDDFIERSFFILLYRNITLYHTVFPAFNNIEACSK